MTQVRTASAIAALAWGLSSAAALAQAPPPLAPPAKAAEPDAAAGRKKEAQEHFEKGLALADKESWDAALAEFLRSREIHPTRAAIKNAAVCLRKLGRFDESLDLFEGLLRDYRELPADMKAEAQTNVVELRGQVGTIEVDGAEPGAAITVDGRRRGEHPLLAPLRVVAGSHVVRLYREGFEPFEATLEIAGAQTAHVTARLAKLIQAGRFHVVESRGKSLDVVVDANVVGRTPWEGPVAVGEHTVMLRGEERFGSLPMPVSVRAGQSLELALAAEELDASMRVSPEPGTASVAIDGIFVGRGAWEGRVRPGAHTVAVIADGYFKAEEPVQLGRGGRAVVATKLKRDPRSPLWRKPGRFVFEVEGGAALAPSLGGDIARSCTGSCARGLAAGGFGMFHGGYELGSGLGFGIEAGYLRLDQTTRGRAASVQAVGIKTPDLGTADDTVKLRGFLAGAFAGFGFGERFPLRFRLGAGALLGSISDTRTAKLTTSQRAAYDVGPLVQTPSAAWFYLNPEVRLGLRLGGHFELSAGVGALILLGFSVHKWDSSQAVNAAGDGYGAFPAEALTSTVLFAITPTLAARYDF